MKLRVSPLLAQILVFYFGIASAWDFTNNGLYWGGLCSYGAMQSPISLNSSLVTYAMEAKVALNYQDLSNVYLYLDPTWNHLYMNFSDQDGNITYVDINGTEHYYSLHSVQIKQPAEHYLNGVQHSLEIQMVHVDPKVKNSYAIVSVLFEHSFDVDHDFFLELNPRTSNVNQPRSKLSWASKLWYKLYGNFIMYDGSLTEPYCDENVIWFVFTDVQPYSLFYYLQIRSMVGNKMRRLQNINSRPRSLISKINGDIYRTFRPYNNEQGGVFANISVGILIGFCVILIAF